MARKHFLKSATAVKTRKLHNRMFKENDLLLYHKLFKNMLRNKSRVVKTGEKPTIIAFYFLNITQDEMRIIFCDFGLYCVDFYVLFDGLILERRACVTANKWPVLNSSTVDNTYAIILSCVLWYTLSAYIKVDGSMPFPRLMPA